MRLAISFTDQSQSFTAGVEFGRLLEKMERGDLFVANNGFPIHTVNETVVRAACKRYGYHPAFSPCIAVGWVEFSATKISPNTN